MPRNLASLNESVFTTALKKYGLNWAFHFINFVIAVSAFSCANSGVYASIRCLYGLSSEGLIPKFFMKLNKYDIPQIATFFSIVPMWIFMIPAYFFGETRFFTMMLGMSGFTGSICWGGIIASVLLLRYKLYKRKYDSNVGLTSRSLFFPVLPIIGFFIVIFSLIMMAFQDGMLSSFIFSLAWTIVPMIVFYFFKRFGKILSDEAPHNGEIPFDIKFPIQLEDYLIEN